MPSIPEPTSKRRVPWTLLRAAIALQLFTAFAACSDSFFSAEVTGFVRRERVAQDGGVPTSGPGINGTALRMYFDRPESFDDEGFVSSTTTLDNRSAGSPLAGYYRASLVWETSSPDYGGSGDRERIWIAARHDDYADGIAELPTVLSGTINVAPDIALEGLQVGPDAVIGRVVMNDGAANRVRVVLMVHGSGSVYETRTKTIDGEDGLYVFDQVRWPADQGVTQAAVIAVEDPSYLLYAPTTVTLEADQTVLVPEPLLVRVAYFSTKGIHGRVLNVAGQGVNGVRVSARPQNARFLGVTTSTATTTVDGEDGVYQFHDFTWPLPPSVTAVDAGGTQPVLLKVNDDAFEQTSPADNAEMRIDVGPLQEVQVAEDFVVSRKPRSTFSAAIRGRCVEPIEGDELRGVSGVEVVAEFTDDDGMHTTVARTDAEGSYAFVVRWSRAKQAKEAPVGEDIITLSVTYSSIERSDSTVKFEPTEYNARSWIGVNSLPDAVAEIEADTDAGSD